MRARGSRRSLIGIVAYSTKEIRGAESAADRARFGEYLVECRAIDRRQLLVALQLQDRMSGALLGECLVSLGFVSRAQVDRHLSAFLRR